MSQAGELNVVQNHPAIPTSFSTNGGTAIPLGNELEILGAGGLTTAGVGNTITITSNGGLGETITGNSGGPVAPTAGNWNTFGAGSITIIGNPATSTLTTELTGLNNHAVLVGAGTTTITNVGPTATAGQVLQSNGLAADPSFSTATYPSTTTINQILYSSATNIVSGLATANNATLTTSATGTPILTSMATNGGILIGSVSGPPLVGTLTPGVGVTITNAANTITIAATGGSFAWVDSTSATQPMSIQTGYVSDRSGGVVFTLPVTAALGDQVRLVGKLGPWSIAQNAGQQIVVSSASSTVGVGGSVASTNVGDCIWLVCITANTTFRAESFVGNLTVT